MSENINICRDGDDLYIKISDCSLEKQQEIENFLNADNADQMQKLSSKRQIKKADVKDEQIALRNDVLNSIPVLKSCYQNLTTQRINKNSWFFKVYIDWMTQLLEKMKMVSPEFYTDENLEYLWNTGYYSFWNQKISSFLQYKQLDFNTFMKQDRSVWNEAYNYCCNK